MNITAALLAEPLVWAASIAYGLVLVAALRSAPWHRLSEPEQLHVFMGTCVLLMVVWSLRAGIVPGMTMHFLGLTVLTLMFGWQLALIGASLILFGANLFAGIDWTVFAINALLSAVVPVLTSYAVYRIVERALPNHFFIYVYLCACGGGAIAVSANALAVVSILALTGVYPMSEIVHDYVIYMPLLVFPEAVLNGMLVTLLACFKPQWLWTFDDQRYLHNK
jgi:uncharacterized membrane protein